MGIFQQFPYTNFHEMNLDQIIKIMREMQDEWEATKTEWASYKDFIDNYFANLDLSAETLQAIRTMASTGELNTVVDPTIIAAVTAWLADNITQPTTPAIDTSLTIAGAAADAKATGDVDAEMKADLRTLADYGAANYHFKGSDGAHSGITYSWNRYVCTVTGSASSVSVNPLIARSPLPTWIDAGRDYYVEIGSNNPLVTLNFVFYNSGGTATYKSLTASENVTIPWDCVEWSVRLYINSGTVITGSATIYAFIRYYPEIAINADFARTMSSTGENLFLANTPDTIPSSTVNLSGVKNNDNSYHIVANNLSTTGILNCYYNKKRLPDGMKAGNEYKIGFTSTKFRVVVISYTSEADSGTVLYEKVQDNDVIQNGNFTIPNNATGLAIRVMYVTSTAVSITEDLSIAIVNVPFYENNTAKLCCIGNSFTGGSVWVNGVFDHMSSFYNTIPAQIGLALNLNRFNIRNFMYSSTGMLYNAGYGNFHDLIKNNLNINNYEYVLTLFASGDISSYALGSESSTANDGTLAGAVIDLANHFKVTNDKCRLIVLGVPPYSADAPHTGATVFSGNWAQGYSIDDLDKLMYKLSKTYHFIYISWQDLSMSYHYMDFADYTPGDTGARHANDESTYYALGRYAALQLQAVNSPIALTYLTE